jgi:hypothetical protein
MNFNAARSWYDYRFMRREGPSLRYRSSICHKTSDDFQKKLLNFQRYGIQLSKKQNCTFNHTGNTHEMVVYFVILLNYTDDAKIINTY